MAWLLCAAVLRAAQAPEPRTGGEPLAERIFTLRHQPPAEVVALVYPLLSPRGAVEIRAGASSLWVRDEAAILARVAALVAEIDRASRQVRVSLQIVAARAGEGAAAESDPRIAPELAQRLRELLRYTEFRQLGAADLEGAEGAAVSGPLGAAFSVEFRLGRVDASRRLRLEGFRIVRRAPDAGGGRGEEPRPLIHTNLNLRLDQPMVLGLARTESSDTALMLILRGAVDSVAAEP